MKTIVVSHDATLEIKKVFQLDKYSRECIFTDNIREIIGKEASLCLIEVNEKTIRALENVKNEITQEHLWVFLVNESRQQLLEGMPKPFFYTDFMHLPVSKDFAKAKVAAWQQWLKLIKEISQNKEDTTTFDLTSLDSAEDPITGLWAKNSFMRHLTREIAMANRYEMAFSFLLLDIDHFSMIKQKCNNTQCNDLLRQIAKRISSSIRDSDVVGRMKLDQFAVLLGNINSSNNAARITEIILHVIEKPYRVGNELIDLKSSVGIAMYPEDGETTEKLLDAAKTALQKAKVDLEHDYKFNSETFDQTAVFQHDILRDLRRALRASELELHFQPQIDYRQNKVIGAEALLRWNHPQRGWIPPDQFIPLAEDSGFIKMVNMWVIDQLCRSFSIINRHHDFYLSFNISARELETDEVVAGLNRAFERYSISANNIHVELTERILISEAIKKTNILQKLKSIGLSIALDDFGTGYSGLTYLHELPIDVIKIDRKFVSNIHEDYKKQILISAMLSMANLLGLAVIAEGIEDKQEAEFLLDKNCYFMQGFYFAKPMPLAELIKFLSNKELEQEDNERAPPQNLA